MIRDALFAVALSLPVCGLAGQVVLEDGPLRRFRDDGKAAFETLIDPEEHVRGFASVGDQANGVANARQEFCGHYLDLCATYWQLDRLPCAREYGRRVLHSAANSMSPDGYVGGEVEERRADAFSLWNQSHAVYGLLRFAEATGDEAARATGLRAAGWLLRTLDAMSPERLVDARLVGNNGSQHLVALYALCMAAEIGARGEDSLSYLGYVRKTLAGLEKTKMNLLANPDCLALQSQKGIEMLNAWRGVLRYAKLDGDARAVQSSSRYWRSIADTQVRNTGASTNRERFLPDGNAPAILPVEMKPNENCVQCGWIRFSREVFSATGDVRCAHEMERTLYNHILGSVSSDCSDFAYYQGNVGRKAFRMNGLYQCCRYRGFAIMAHLPELVLDDDGTNVTPLVYAPLSYRSDDGLALRVATEYPRTGRLEFRVAAKAPRKLRLPIPAWCREWTLSVDGRAVDVARDDARLPAVFVDLEPSRETTVVLDLKMDFVREEHDIGGRRYAEYAYGPLVLVRDTGLGDVRGEPLPANLRFERVLDSTVFAKFTAVDGEGRAHTLVDYAHACRANPEADEFEVFVPVYDSMCPDACVLESDVLAVRVEPEKGGVSVWDRRSGRTWRCAGAPLAGCGLALTNVVAEGRTLKADLVSAGEGVVGEAKFRMKGAELGVEMKFKAIPEKGRLFPAPFESRPDDAAVIPLSEGFRIPFAECDLVSRDDIRAWHGEMSMSFFGVVDNKDECGWMAVLETPEDAALRCVPEGRRLGGMAPLWKPELDKPGYPRRVRFVFFDRGGYVAMAKRYRALAKRRGLVKTFQEKAKERPLVERLPGAANVWYFPGRGEPSHAKVAAELRDAGIGRFLWSSCAPARDVEVIAAMPDVLVGRYDVCRDVYYPELLDALGWQNPPKSEICRNTSAWPDDVVWDGAESNTWRRAWGMTCKDGNTRYCAAQCDIPAVARLERNVAEELRATPFTARFIDVVTAVGWEECRNPAHPMTRRVSRRAKADLLKMLCERFSLVVGSEQGKDDVVPYCDYFEGMMSPRCARMPHGRAGYGRAEMFGDDGGVPKQLSPKELDRVTRYALNEKYRIPLFELVYHDCVASHWYWYDYSNQPICFWKKRDLFNALYGTAPMYIFDYGQWTRRKAEFVESWKRVGGIARDSGFSEMTSHSMLKPDGSVQETRFANGLVVTVDFANGTVNSSNVTTRSGRSGETVFSGSPIAP